MSHPNNMLLLATLGPRPSTGYRPCSLYKSNVVCALDSEAYDMKTFNIANNRILKLGKSNDDMRILDKTTREAVFTAARWASFLLRLDEIDDQLCKLTQGEDVAYQVHYGGGWNVSLRKGFAASTYANSTYRSGKQHANLPRLASLYDSTNGRLSSRLSPAVPVLCGGVWLIHPFRHNRHGPRIGGLFPLFFGEGLNTKSLRPRPSSMPSGILIHPAVWPQWTWAENGELCPLFRGAGYPSNTMWPRSWPIPCQVSS